MWSHFIFESFCSFHWDDNSEFYYELNLDTDSDDWIDKGKKIPNPDYDPDKLPQKKPDFCSEPGEMTMECWEKDCPYLYMCPVDEDEYHVMMDAWEKHNVDKEDD